MVQSVVPVAMLVLATTGNRWPARMRETGGRGLVWTAPAGEVLPGFWMSG